MFSDKLNEVYIVTRKYQYSKEPSKLDRYLDNWVCLTKQRAEETIKESQEMDINNVYYVTQCVLLR